MSGVNCSREVGVHALGERFDRERFGQAGHAFQQHVAVGKQADNQPLDEHFLADNDLAHLSKSGCTKALVRSTSSLMAVIPAFMGGEVSFFFQFKTRFGRVRCRVKFGRSIP